MGKVRNQRGMPAWKAYEEVASYPGSLIIAGEEKRAWFQSLTHAPIAPEFWGDSILQ